MGGEGAGGARGRSARIAHGRSHVGTGHPCSALQTQEPGSPVGSEPGAGLQRQRQQVAHHAWTIFTQAHWAPPPFTGRLTYQVVAPGRRSCATESGRPPRGRSLLTPDPKSWIGYQKWFPSAPPPGWRQCSGSFKWRCDPKPKSGCAEG
jgi:hypothetical protein